MTRTTRQLDPEYRKAAEERSYLVPADDMAAVQLGVSIAASAANAGRTLQPDERAKVLQAYAIVARNMVDLPCNLEGHVRRAKGRI